MDYTSNGSMYACRLPKTEAATRTEQPQRKSRKRKNTSELDKHGDSQHLQPSSKVRRNDRPRASTSTAAVASTSSSTAATTNLPHSYASTTTTTAAAAATAAAPGLSMPSISSSSSLGSNSKTTAFSSDYTSDTQGSSEFPIASDFESYPLDSPATFGSNVLSPPCDLLREEAVGLSEWLAKGDTTPLDGAEHLYEVCFHKAAKPAAAAAATSGFGVVPASCYLTPSHKQRVCPLPSLSWTDTHEMWDLMCRKDDLAWLAREPNMFDDHPGLQPRMRSILIDWLNEVCEVYKLHRETYFLAVDYIDRYLSLKKELKKNHLQLLGITALFIAAKAEEIYPPKIGEFAYVTDGACTDEDILREELLILSALDWKINPVTVIGWLGLYMQINVTSRDVDVPVRSLKRKSNSTAHNTASTPSPKKRKITDENADVNNIQQAAVTVGLQQQPLQQQQKVSSSSTSTANKTDDAFVYPQFSGMEFAHTAQLIDLCSLDVGFANFKYSVIAAAALSHTFDRKTATFVSGLPWEEIAPCAKWMEPFFLVICDENASCPLTFLESNDPIKHSHGLKHICPNLVSDSSHIIQTHTTSLDMLDLVSIKIEQMESCTRMGQLEASPAPIGIIESEDGILTPPASNRKSLETLGGVSGTAVSKVASEAIASIIADASSGTWSHS
uniref:Uncharacterized protein n=1 Tax=Anopheles gambiae TaxID=7165 RepID=A0A1S4GYA8_ANOGA